MLAIRFHQKSNIFREKVYFFFKNVRKSSSLQTKKYYFPLTTAPTFFRCKTQKMYTTAGLPRAHDFEWLEQEFSWFSRTIWTETNRKTKKTSFDEKKRTQQQYDFIKNQRFLKKKSIFSWKCLKSWWLSEFRRLGGLFFFGIVQNHGFREFELVNNLSGIVGFPFDYATEYFQSLFTTDFSVLAELLGSFIDSLAFFFPYMERKKQGAQKKWAKLKIC